LKRSSPPITALQNAASLGCLIHRKVILVDSHLTLGHVPLAFITATHSELPASIVKDLNDLVRKKIGGIASLAGVVVLEKIPKTRSGKTLRRVLREIVEKGIDGDWNSELAVPATVEDRSHVDWAREKVKAWQEQRSKNGKAKL
jgi:propionyl-CoA synthetase